MYCMWSSSWKVVEDHAGEVSHILLWLVLKFNIFLFVEVTRGAKYSRHNKMAYFFPSVIGCKMQTTDKL